MNPLLQQAQQDTLAKADPRLKPAIQHVIDAGKALMFGKDTQHMLFKALGQGSPDLIGKSFAGMAVLIFARSGSKLPMQVLVPAATVLLCEGLQFLEDAGGTKIDADYLAAAEKSMGEMLLQLLKANPQKIQQAAMAAKQAGQAPAAPATPAAPGGIISGAMQ